MFDEVHPIGGSVWHVLEYPNGDRTHCFAMWFSVRKWRGTLSLDHESLEGRFFGRDSLPAGTVAPARLAVELYEAFLETGRFQAR